MHHLAFCFRCSLLPIEFVCRWLLLSKSKLTTTIHKHWRQSRIEMPICFYLSFECDRLKFEKARTSVIRGFVVVRRLRAVYCVLIGKWNIVAATFVAHPSRAIGNITYHAGLCLESFDLCSITTKHFMHSLVFMYLFSDCICINKCNYFSENISKQFGINIL